MANNSLTDTRKSAILWTSMQRLEAKLLVEENMTIQNMDCVLRLKANKWIVSFLYHDEPVCLELCRDYLPKCYLKTVAEWTVEDYWRSGGLMRYTNL